MKKFIVGLVLMLMLCFACPSWAADDCLCAEDTYENYDNLSSCMMGDDSASKERFVFTYLNQSDNKYYARVGTVQSNGSVLYGVVSSSWSEVGDVDEEIHEMDTHAIDKLTDSTFILVYRKAGESENHNFAVVGSISGLGSSAAITFDTTNQGECDDNREDLYHMDVAVLSPTKFVVVGRARFYSYNGRAQAFIGTVSGTSVTGIDGMSFDYIPDDVPFYNRYTAFHVVEKLDSDKFIWTYRRCADGADLRLIVGNVDEYDDITFGDQQYIVIDDTQSRDIAVLEADRFALVYRGDETSGNNEHAIRIRIGEIDGNDDITFGSLATIGDEFDADDEACYESHIKLPRVAVLSGDSDSDDGVLRVVFSEENYCGWSGKIYTCTITNGTSTTVTCDSDYEMIIDTTYWRDMEFDNIYTVDTDNFLTVRYQDLSPMLGYHVVMTLVGGSTPQGCVDIDDPPSPHGYKKNRYISFAPGTTSNDIAIRVEMMDSEYFSEAEGILGWVGEPDEDNVSAVVSTPYYSDSWPSVVHVGSCEITPVATYMLYTTKDAEVFDDGFEVSTIDDPGNWYWADIVGFKDGGSWTAPNGVVNFDDITAAIEIYLDTAGHPHWTCGDIDPETPDKVVNFTDIQYIVDSFTYYDEYPFTFCEE